MIERGLLPGEDELELVAQAREVLAARAPVGRFRALRDAGQTFDAELWTELIGLGWGGIPFSEDDGGLGFGLPGLALVAEEAGRGLALLPLGSLAAAAARGDTSAIEGAVTALAWREVARGDALHTRAEAGHLQGYKRDVDDLSAASSALVTTVQGVFQVEITDDLRHARRRVDGRDAGDLRLDRVPGAPVDGDLVAARAAADVIRCAEALGAMSQVFELTRLWLLERRQFGVPIGSFQVLQHRAVDAWASIELVRALVRQASLTPTPAVLAATRRKTAAVFLNVTKEAVQMHGGIGVTEECDVGLYLKRALACAAELYSG
jgi:alkylation response protein AidB-like acyl-CoA dehydrogenase